MNEPEELHVDLRLERDEDVISGVADEGVMAGRAEIEGWGAGGAAVPFAGNGGLEEDGHNKTMSKESLVGKEGERVAEDTRGRGRGKGTNDAVIA
jgi:hypothetical protein